MGIFDDMEPAKAVSMIGNCMRRSGSARWTDAKETKTAVMNLLDKVIRDDGEKIETRLDAVGKFIAIEGQNQSDDKLQAQIAMSQLRVDDPGEKQERVILVLPSNGSEVKNE